MAVAQDDEADTSAPAASPTDQGQADEVELKEFWLPDAAGKLQRVLGFTFEEFEQAYQQLQGHGDRQQQPRYSLQRVSLRGNALETFARLDVELQILVREEGWVRVPVRLNEAVLQEPERYEGPGEYSLDFEPQGEGYVARFRGQADQQHRLKMKVLVPLTAVGEKTRMRLFVPRATSSELKLKVPLAPATAEVSEGATLDMPPAVQGNQTEFTVVGPWGDFELAWHKPDGRVAETPVVLEAVGSVLSRIENESIDCEAALSVRSFGAPFDQFHIRIPRGARLVTGSPSGYRLAMANGDGEQGQEGLVEVTLTEATSGPIDVRLTTTQPRQTAKATQWFELGGFEVVEAARQWGHIAVASTGEREVLWGPNSGVRRVDELPEALDRQDVVAGFEYFAKPYSLTARMVTRTTRIGVEPEYVLQVGAHRVQLEATLKYTVRGPKVFVLDVPMSGWELDDVGPENLVSVDGAGIVDGILTVPLVQPTSGQLELRIQAHRDLAEDAKSLVVTLPQPEANSTAPPAVWLVPDDNVQLIPNRQGTVGLVRQQMTPKRELPQRQQRPLFYRGDAGKAAFAADLHVLAQSIDVAVDTQVVLDEQNGRVEQKMTYSIGHEPTDHLLVEVPRELAGPEAVEFRSDGKPVAAQRVAAAPSPEDEAPAGPIRFQLQFPDARIGLCEVTASYEIAWPKAAAGRVAELEIPLVTPAEGVIAENRLSVAAPAGTTVELLNGPWVVSKTSVSGPRSGQLQLTSEEVANYLRLRLDSQENADRESIVVDRAWVQTRLTREIRQDRAVFAFTSNRKQVELFLPRGTSTSQMEVLLDGKRVAEQIVEDGHLVVALGGDNGHGRHLLELRSYIAGARPPRGQFAVEIPHLGTDTWVRCLYWQLIVPRDEHVLSAPRGFTSEFSWGWDGYFLGRHPLLDQNQLESWAGMPRSEAVAEGVNCYLFSTVGTATKCELRTAGRAWIVLVASGAALVAGLLLLYVPAARHPGTLFVAAIVLLAIGIRYPEPMMLISQAAGLGLGLTLLAGLLQRSVARRRRDALRPEPSSSVLEKGSTQTQLHPPLAVSQSSTATVPAALPPSTPDTNA